MILGVIFGCSLQENYVICKQWIELNILSVHASAPSTIIVTQFRFLGQFLLSPSINPSQKDLVAPDCQTFDSFKIDVLSTGRIIPTGCLFLSAKRIRCTDDTTLVSWRNKCELSFWNPWGIALDADLPKAKWLTAFEQKLSCEILYTKVILKQHQSFDVVSKSRPI